MTKPLSELITELLEMEAKATAGPWWNNGMDVESSHLTVGEGEELTELYDTKTDRPNGKRIKRHATEGPFTKKAQGLSSDDILIFTTSSILGDRDVDEALSTAEFIAHSRNHLKTILKALREAQEVIKDTYEAAKFGDFPGLAMFTGNWLRKYSGEK